MWTAIFQNTKLRFQANGKGAGARSGETIALSCDMPATTWLCATALLNGPTHWPLSLVMDHSGTPFPNEDFIRGCHQNGLLI